MMIRKVALPRRTVLRGFGVTLALPLLDAMVPALTVTAKTAAAPVKRLGFFYVPNGMAKADIAFHTNNGAGALRTPEGGDYWTPKGEGATFDFSPILQPLAPYRAYVTVLSGLSQRQADPTSGDVGDHSRATATWLNGVRPKRTEGSDVRAGTTIDQIIADKIGQDTQLPSLELSMDPTFVVGSCENGYSCVYVNTLSWRTPTTPVQMETNPSMVFERLFGQGGSPAQRRAQAADSRSILDSVAAGVEGLHRKLGPSDRLRVDEYLDSVREIERRVQKAEASTGESQLPELEKPVGIPTAFGEYVKLMADLLVLAYQADITRISTFLLGREVSARSYPELGVPESHHGISHHQNDPKSIAKLAKINTYHVSLLAAFLEKLRTTPDGDGTLLDHSLLLYGAGLSNSQLHTHAELPLVIVGRTNSRASGGRHNFYKETPMTNLLLTMADAVGVPADTLGDSTGRLDLEPVTL
jgi:hypothetical protein